MRVFCPSCGTQNQGTPGGRVACATCGAAFDVPRESAPVEARPPAAPPAAPYVPPAAPYAPPAPFAAQAPMGSAERTNPLAIASLVCGVLCCLPFNVAAVVTGFMAIKQIDTGAGPRGGKGLAVAGTTLGVLSLGLTAVGLLFQLLAR